MHWSLGGCLRRCRSFEAARGSANEEHWKKTKAAIHPHSHPPTHPSAQPSIRPAIKQAIRLAIHPLVQPRIHRAFRPSTSQPCIRTAIRPSSQSCIRPARHPPIPPATHPLSQPFIHPSSTQAASSPAIRPSTQPSIRQASHPYMLCCFAIISVGATLQSSWILPYRVCFAFSYWRLYNRLWSCSTACALHFLSGDFTIVLDLALPRVLCIFLLATLQSSLILLHRACFALSYWWPYIRLWFCSTACTLHFLIGDLTIVFDLAPPRVLCIFLLVTVQSTLILLYRVCFAFSYWWPCNRLWSCSAASALHFLIGHRTIAFDLALPRVLCMFLLVTVQSSLILLYRVCLAFSYWWLYNRLGSCSTACALHFLIGDFTIVFDIAPPRVLCIVLLVTVHSPLILLYRVYFAFSYWWLNNRLWSCSTACALYFLTGDRTIDSDLALPRVLCIFLLVTVQSSLILLFSVCFAFSYWSPYNRPWSCYTACVVHVLIGDRTIAFDLAIPRVFSAFYYWWSLTGDLTIVFDLA